MLELKQIIKDYRTGDSDVRALDGISLKFREHEFVSILGPSGCGKTTLLNIVGGLDQYTSGDLIINGVSTKEYTDADWDTYRNHSVGFVFQSYNLIPHQTVLSNVELALTLSGISAKERRQRATQALEDVGLGDQLNKKPNQLSGGQMQRVAIARALVNDPDILLADEPTGALDTKTSVQIMEILKKISQKKLIIMVTHNPELAREYSSRIISVLDGHVVDDTDPYPLSPDTETAVASAKKRSKQRRTRTDGAKKKKSMSFWTALSLSLNNLMTKKGRTFMTSFAGSIGIIGIALILSVSTGVNNYINSIQRDTLASYPITLKASSTDLSSVMTTLMQTNSGAAEDHRDSNRVYETQVIEELMNSINTSKPNTNDLKAFKKHLEQTEAFDQYLTAIQYTYDFNWTILTKDTSGNVVKSDVMELLNSIYGGGSASGLMGSLTSSGSIFSDSGSMMYSSLDVWEEMIPGKDGEQVNDIIKDEYDLIYGEWPQAYNEIMLVVTKNNEISDLALYALGLRTEKEITDELMAAIKGDVIELDELRSWSYEELCGMTFRMLLQSECYQVQADGTYVDSSKTDIGRNLLYNNADLGVDLKIVGIIRPNDTATSAILDRYLVYTSALTEYAIRKTADSDLLKRQLNNPDTDILTGLPFKPSAINDLTPDEKKAKVQEYVATLSVNEKAAFAKLAYESYVSDSDVEKWIQTIGEETLIQMLAEQLNYSADDLRTALGNEEIRKNILYPILKEKILDSRDADTAFKAMGLTTDEAIANYMDQYVTSGMSSEEYELAYDQILAPTYSESTYEDNLELLGNVDLDAPDGINLFSATFEDKDEVERLIKEYNASVDEEQKISWTDYVALLMSSVTMIVDAITYVLIAFVAISLIVSSIMIGIITYISVLERTKEIGILRAIGASKKDIRRVFNAETLIVGFVAGAIGILITLGLVVIINIILFQLTAIPNLQAFLPPTAAVILVCISMFLTFIAGLFPSGFAAKRNPVEALRSE